MQLSKQRARTYHIIQFDPISKAQLLKFIVTCKAILQNLRYASMYPIILHTAQ